MSPPKHHPPAAGFSLMEIVISLAILAVAITTIFLTLGQASRSAGQSVGISRAVAILEHAFADISAASVHRFPQSPQFAITLPNPNTPELRELLWFDAGGSRVATRQDAYFRCELTFHQDPQQPALVHLHGLVAWPARATEGQEPNQTELLTSLLLP